MTLRIAFIGAGQMARHHASAIGRSGERAEVAGVFDTSPGQADAFAAFANTRAFRSPEAMFAEIRPDVVHVCTPPHAHFAGALAALHAGAHVYVEKPFTPSVDEARALIAAAERHNRLIAAGHQLLRDPAFSQLLERVPRLGAPVHIDSHFAFRPAGLPAARLEAERAAELVVDVLPHPLYTLVAALERCAPGQSIGLAWSWATPTDVQAVLRAGPVVGRLSISLRARPVASSLSVVGTTGTISCDFMRSMIAGVPNPGTEPVEKLLNPVVEGAALVARGGASIVRRIRSGGYAGLSELIGAFYRAIRTGGPSPVSPEHLLIVTSLAEPLVSSVRAAAADDVRVGTRTTASPEPLVALTGASGFLGTEICRARPRVRGIGRRRPTAMAPGDWVTADLSQGLDAESLRGVEVVVHAAAATSGGFDAHQRHTIDATRNLLAAMKDAGVGRLVLVSSLSVIRPPRNGRERQREDTPRPGHPRPYGAYTWGKCLQEQLVEAEASRLGIAIRIVRPGALLDPHAPELPGLVGRRIFGRWHLGLGRPGLPTAVCDVDACAAAVAWCATHFDQAPRVINLLDPRIATRRDLIARLRARGWKGRVLWVPISAMAAGLSGAQAAWSIVNGRRPEGVAAWSVLRPRRYDASVASQVLEASSQPPTSRADAPAVPIGPLPIGDAAR